MDIYKHFVKQQLHDLCTLMIFTTKKNRFEKAYVSYAVIADKQYRLPA